MESTPRLTELASIAVLRRGHSVVIRCILIAKVYSREQFGVRRLVAAFSYLLLHWS